MSNNSRHDLILKVKESISELYSLDSFLLERKLCERCLVHRLAVYLEKRFSSYFVDCEFNKSFYREIVGNKVLSNINGNYVDIIVHNRNNIPGDNLLCFEIKRSTNYSGRDKDRENLRILTAMGRFEYQLGFYIILGNSLGSTVVELYSDGRILETIMF